MTCEKLKTLVKWKKRDGDKAIPSRKEDLEKRWGLTKKRPSPNSSPCSSDVEDGDNESLEEELEYESDLESIEADDNVVILYAVQANINV